MKKHEIEKMRHDLEMLKFTVKSIQYEATLLRTVINSYVEDLKIPPLYKVGQKLRLFIDGETRYEGGGFFGGGFKLIPPKEITVTVIKVSKSGSVPYYMLEDSSGKIYTKSEISHKLNRI